MSFLFNTFWIKSLSFSKIIIEKHKNKGDKICEGQGKWNVLFLGC